MIVTRRAILLLALAGCGEGSHGEPPPPFAGSCRVLSAEALDPADAPLGFTAEEAAALAPVRAGYRLLYGTEPGAPSTALEVGIESYDPSRVFLVHASLALVGDVEIPCPPALTFPAVIRFRSADGLFDEALPVDLFATGVASHEWLAHLPAGAQQGAWAPPDEPGWRHVGTSFGARVSNGAGAGGVSLVSQGGGATRSATVAIWGVDPPGR